MASRYGAVVESPGAGRPARRPARPAGPGSPTAREDRVVGLLRQEWAALAGLLAGLSDEQWARPALPGWDVHDVVAHLTGIERLLSGAAQPPLPEGAEAGGHVRNEIGRVNEAWVLALRGLSHGELLAAFREITRERLAALSAMSPADLEAPAWTPVGNATYGRLMLIRVFDCWMHEQDIRAAAGVPGHEDGAVAEQCLSEVVAALGYIVGKRGQAPEGSSVRISLSGPMERDLLVAVRGGRAGVVDALDGEPAASLRLPSSLFLRLAGGRQDPRRALPGIELGGDEALAERIATHLAFTI